MYIGLPHFGPILPDRRFSFDVPQPLACVHSTHCFNCLAPRLVTCTMSRSGSSAPEALLDPLPLTPAEQSLLDVLNATERVLVAQAVYELGNDDFRGVAKLLQGHALLKDKSKTWFSADVGRLSTQLQQTRRVLLTWLGAERRRLQRFTRVCRSSWVLTRRLFSLSVINRSP